MLHRLDAVASTMDLLHDLAERGAAAGTAIVAAEQTAGRGSRGRTWHSPRGGLWLSVLLRPEAAGSGLLALRAGLAAARALEEMGPAQPIGIKWPNDLMAGGRKLGGVLCEARWSGNALGWVAVGLGVNVSNPPPESLRGTAAALDELVPGVTPEAVLDAVLPKLRALDGASPRLHPAELTELRRRDWLRGRPIAGPVAGTAEGITADGALCVRRSDGAVAELRAGTVELAGQPRTP